MSLKEYRKASCLTQWFPLIRDAGVPVPKTEIVETDLELIHICDGMEAFLKRIDQGAYTAFLSSLRNACRSVSEDGPWFLRTGHFSGKHNWENTCYVTDLDRLERHVSYLVNDSMLVDFLGLPTNFWVVRAFLPTKPLGWLTAYGGMPLCREFRCFVSNGEVVCIHPYWPRKAIIEGFEYPCPGEDTISDLYFRSSSLGPDERGRILKLALQVATVVPGDWSVDILDTKDGWYVTDMAVAHESFHWEGCEKAEPNS